MLLKFHHWYVGKIDTLLTFIKSFLVKEKTTLDILKEKIDELDPSGFEGFNSSANSLKTVKSQFKSLMEINDELKVLCIHIKGKKTIYSSLYAEPLLTIDVSVFFLSEKGNYIDEASYVKVFKERTKDYFELFNQLRNSTDPIDNRNALYLSGFSSRLEQTIQSLLQLQDSPD
jgi:hypothetical protein